MSVNEKINVCTVILTFSLISGCFKFVPMEPVKAVLDIGKSRV